MSENQHPRLAGWGRRGLLGSASGIALAAALAAASGTASAQCVPAAPTTGQTTTCSGDFPAGITFTDPNVDDLTVVVSPGATAEFVSSGAPGLGFGFRIIRNGGTITEPTGGADGAFAGLLAATSDAGYVTIINTGEITTSTNAVHGIVGLTNVGALTITTSNDIRTYGTDAQGILALSNGGTIVVTSDADIDTAGNGGIAVRAENAGNGTIQVSANGAITTGDADAGTGNYAPGIYAKGVDGDITIELAEAGRITTVGTGGRGISAGTSGIGNVAISAYGPIATQGDDAHAILAANTLTGDLEVSQLAEISTRGLNAVGIAALGSAGDVKVTSRASIDTAGDGGFGIRAETEGAGTVHIYAYDRVTIAGDLAAGVYATSADGDITIVATGGVGTAGSGGRAVSGIAFGAGNVGIRTEGALETLGSDAHGITAGSTGTGDVTVMQLGEISTQGYAATGLLALSYGGDVAVTSHAAIDTAGDGAFGIRTQTEGTGTIVIRAYDAVTVGDVDAGTGDLAAGIYAKGADGDITIVATGSVATTGLGGRGVSGLTSGMGNVAVRAYGAIETLGANAHGITAGSGTTGDARVLQAGAVSTQGEAAYGIIAVSSGGAIEITSEAAIETAGAMSDGIRASTSGAGTILIRTGAAITVTGDATGIAVLAGADLDVYVGGPVTAGGHGLNLGAVGPVYAFVDGPVSGGTGASAGIKLVSGAGSAVLVIGTAGSVGAASNRAIQGDAESDRVYNYGTVTGFVELGDGDDLFRNYSATSFDAIGDSDFGGDTGAGDVFDNDVNGAFRVLSTGGDNVETVNLLGLERFFNYGAITLQDEETGAGTPVAGDLLTFSGDLNGVDGTLRLDSYLNDGVVDLTDRIVVDGNTNGSAAIFVRGIGTGAETDNDPGDGILVVEVNGQASNAVYELGAPVLSSLFEYELVKDGPDWFLRTLRALDEPFEYPAIVTAAQGVWHQGAAALHERMALLRPGGEHVQTASLEPVEFGQVPPPTGGGGRGIGFWARGFGAGLEVDADDVAFDQSVWGFEVGADMTLDGALGTGGTLLLGAMAGYVGSAIELDDSETEAELEGPMLGVYGIWLSGPLHVDALIQAQFLSGDYDAPSIGLSASPDMLGIGASVEAGYKLAIGAGFVEPQAQLAYVNVDGDFEDHALTEVELDGSSLVGRLGARAGYDFGAVAPYVEASVLHEFLGKNEADIGGALTVEQDIGGTALRLGGGVQGEFGGVSFFADLDYTFGDVQEGIRGSAGVRISW